MTEETKVDIDHDFGFQNLEGCSSLHNTDSSSGLCLYTSRHGELTTN